MPQPEGDAPRPPAEGAVVSPAEQEQRNTRRFALQLPVSVKYVDGATREQAAQTRDVSARGVFFYMDSNLKVGSDLEFTLTLPSEITLTESIRVRCKGKVVRVEEKGTQRIGVAAAIDQYDFISEG
ncbi:MAG: PilZ domain-containing protein [Acidobacteria bacterium]|nr:PilZ domain-containing protein [Acidobacteriota bacterium]